MRAVWIYLLLFAAGSVAAAEIYRSVDASGNVIYSDRPTGDDTQTIFIDTDIATPAVSGDETSDPATDQDPLFFEVDDPAATEDQGTSADSLAAQREENCAIARDRDERYQVAHRIYRGTEDNREYLTDDELDAIRAQAAADVEEWCS